jgi:hypothetical protein
VVVGQGTRLFPDTGPDMALDVLESRATPNGITIQVYGPPAPAVRNRHHVTKVPQSVRVDILEARSGMLNADS